MKRIAITGVRIIDPLGANKDECFANLINDYNLLTVDHQIDYNESDPNQLNRLIASQADQCINILNFPTKPA